VRFTSTLWKKRSSIRTRVLAVAAVPVVASSLIGVAVSAYLAVGSEHLRSFSSKFEASTRPAADFITAIQEERRLTMLGMAARDPAPSPELLHQREVVNSILATLKTGALHVLIHGADANFQKILRKVDNGSQTIPTLRGKIDSGQLTIPQVYAAFNMITDAFAAAVEAGARTAPTIDTFYGQLGAAQLFRAADYMGRSASLIAVTLKGGAISDAAFQELVRQVGAYHSLLDTAAQDMTTAEQLRLAGLESRSAWKTVVTVENAFLSAGLGTSPASASSAGALGAGAASTPAPGTAGATGNASSGDGSTSSASPTGGTNPTAAATDAGTTAAPSTGTGAMGRSPADVVAALGIDAKQWQEASQDVNSTLVSLYADRSVSASKQAADSADNLMLRSVLFGAGLLLAEIIVGWIAIRLANKIVRRLVALKTETLALADETLPGVVERLRAGEHVDIVHEVPVLDHGDDEVGQVAQAFNKAQQTAVVAAAHEARTRAGTRTVFLNIAYRSQVVVHRQLELLDQAERMQEDPELLTLLFSLDHLATRARRNAENLIILGGEQPGRRWRQPVSLVTLVRSAIGETEQYARVTTRELPNCQVNGNAVADLVHVLAELLDNATAFAPPTAKVEIRGNIVGRGVVIEIEDQGLGIAPEHRERLNAMLRDVPDFDVMALSAEPRLGLFVVARLAARHGIQVTLSESRSYGGTKAIVLIPSALLAEEAAIEGPSGKVISGSRSSARAAEHAMGETVSVTAVGIGPQRSSVVPQEPPVPVSSSGLPIRTSARALNTGQLPALGNMPGHSAGGGAGPLSGPPMSGSPLGAGTVGGGARITADSSSTRSGSPFGASPLGGSGRTADTPTGRPVFGLGPHSGGAAGHDIVVATPQPVLDGLPVRTRRRTPASDEEPPALPRRQRQSNLAPQLAGEAPRPATSSQESLWGNAEQVRDRFAAIQRGTREARGTDIEPTTSS